MGFSISSVGLLRDFLGKRRLTVRKWSRGALRDLAARGAGDDERNAGLLVVEGGHTCPLVVTIVALPCHGTS